MTGLETERIRGLVERRVVAQGSKSEREALVLRTGEGEYILRRRGGNPFEIDPELATLDGRSVEVRGTPAGTTLLVDDWTEPGD